MKRLLISALATASLFIGATTASVIPAAAGAPKSIHYHGYYYYYSEEYNPQYCIYYNYQYHQYIYCRHYGDGGGSSGY
jgi:hypothetical protein